jgi:hypothetical protein
MNARSVAAAAGVVQAAWERGRQTAAGVAMAIDSAGMLNSPETAAELVRLREERHSTNESVSLASERMRADRDRIDGLESTNTALRARLAEVEGQRAALAERLRAGQTWRQDRLISEDLVSQPELRSIFGIPLAAPLDGITRQIAPVQALREEPPLKGRARLDELTVERAEATHWKRLGLEDPHESPLHRRDLIPRDLPEIRVPFAAETEVEPSGCRYCGIPARVHAQQWKASVGWHKWVLPTQAQIKARMLARRAARTGGGQ